MRCSKGRKNKFMFNIFEHINTNDQQTFNRKEIKDKIAVIGISSKLPKANNYKEFWENLMNKVDCVDYIDNERKLDCNNFFNHIGMNSENLKYQQMAFVSDVDKFDYRYFKIPYQEACLMDPRQRLFLETSFNSLLDAGYTANHIKGQNVGVYVGSSNSDAIYNYDKIIYDSSIRDPISIVNNLPSMIASRVSHYFDLKGPSLTIDTSCSSSLVAVHEACKAILYKECEMAIAGGCNLNLIPLQHDVKLGIESKNYRTKAYDDESDGTGFGEGIISFVLKPLYSALRDKDNIYAVIEASSIQNHGNSLGIATPSLDGQRNLISENLNKSDVDVNNLSFIEGHGTGTAIGDLIELEAMSQVLKDRTAKKQYCPIGSVKNNIGHLLSASGAAGLLKSILAINEKKFPPNINFKTPNKKIDLSDSPIYINKQEVNLDENERLFASISSFGMSGTNCHIIISNYKKERNLTKEKPLIFTLSANDLEILKIKLQEFYHFIYNEQELILTDVSYTLNCRRDHNKYRLAIIASNKEELMKKLYECLTELGKGNESFQLQDAFLNNNLDMKYGQIESGINPLNHDLQNICIQYIKGKNIDWHEIYQYDCQVVSLPVYPFKKTRCWYSEEKRSYILKDDIILNKNEKLIVDAWAKIFGVNEIDLKQDIYEVGGDSLSLVSMYHEIKDKLPDIVLETFIQNENLREILDYVNQKAKKCAEIDELIYETDDYKIFKFSNGVNSSNTYLISSENQTILIDSGVSIDYLTHFCEKEKIKGINHIIFTHSHFDHTYSAQEIKKKFKCSFVMHEKELNFAKDLVNNGLGLMGKSFIFEKSDILLKENKMIKLKGLEFLPILSPGHTSGSICIKIDELLFTGDTLFKDENSGVDKKTGNGELLRRSISYLLNNMNEDTIVCPGHGETCSIKYIKERYKDNNII